MQKIHTFGPRGRNRRARVVFAAAAVLSGAVAAGARSARGATVNWNGPAGASWATGAAWSNGTGPGTGDTAFFGDAGSATLPGEVTSVVNATRTIGGLTFSNTSGKFHTLDLGGAGGNTLSVTGNLNFNLDQVQTTTTTLRNGALNVSGAFANINVGRAVSGTAAGVADLSGLSSLAASVQEVNVATSSFGNATGTLTLSPSNTITAQKVTVGASNSGGETNAALHLGLSNTITAGEFAVATHHSTGLVDIVNGGTFALGTPSVRTILRVADQTTNTNNTYQGRMLLGNAAVNFNLDSLIVAEKQGGPGNAWGNVIGGGSGSVAIGTAAARGNFYVGNTINGGGTSGTVDWGNLNTLTAFVNDVYIGRALTGAATGSVMLPATSTIDAANTVTVGAGAEGSGTLALGLDTTILAGELSVGRDNDDGTITIRGGGTLNLGSAARRANVYLGVGNKNSNAVDAGTLNLSGGSLHAYTNDLIVGQRDGGGGGSQNGTLLAGNSGSIDIGAAGNTANFYVARALAGGGPAIGTADFSGLSSLTASVNTFGVGVATSGSAKGTVTLAAGNTISANSVLVGSGTGDQTSTLELGNVNNIQTPQLLIGDGTQSGTVTIRSGGTLTLGSPSQRTNLSISTAGSTNTPGLYTGTLDLTNATATAYLGNVIIGNKTLSVGGQLGVMTISNLPGNLVDATSIFIGGQQSTGTLKFGGGQLYAGSIAAGAGTANFDWSGGRLSAGTFGTPTVPFNLVNTGTGTLAPGSAANAIGTTAVYGTYNQGAAAAMHIQIAGNSPGTGNDFVSVSGAATFAGRLNLDTINGFVPSVGQDYQIATYASRSGTFAFVDPPALPQNTAFTLEYASNQLLVHMVAPAAKAWTSAAAGGTWGTGSNWSGATVPTTASDITINNTGAAAQKVTVASSTTVHRVTLQGTGAAEELQVLAGTSLGVSNALIVGTGATLSGAGEIAGTVTVAGGTIAAGAPQPAALRVSGDVDVLAGSTLAFDLAGPAASQYDLLDVTGELALAGDLKVLTTGGYSPAAGDSFQLLKFASATGAFDQLTLPPLGPGLMWDTSSLPTTGTISVVVPEPTTAALLMAAPFAAAAARRRRRAAK